MNLKKLQDNLVILFIIVMLICWLSKPVLEHMGFSLGNLPIIITGCVMTVYAFLSLAFEFYRIRSCTEEVPANLVSIKSRHQQSQSFRSYKAIYAYQWQGQHFETAAKTRYTNKTDEQLFSKLSNSSVFVNPNNPEIICDKRSLSLDDLILLIAAIFILWATFSFT